MRLLGNHWSRDTCIWLDCEEPPTDDRETCALHARVHVSTSGSWLDAEVGEAS